MSMGGGNEEVSWDNSGKDLMATATQAANILQFASLNAQRDLKQQAQSGVEALNTGKTEATQSSKLGLEQYKALNAPYGDVGYGALDRYEDILGLTRPKIGNKALSRALEKEANAKDMREKLTAAAYMLDTQFPTWNSGLPNFRGSDAAIMDMDQYKRFLAATEEAQRQGQGLDITPQIPKDYLSTKSLDEQEQAYAEAIKQGSGFGFAPGSDGGNAGNGGPNTPAGSLPDSSSLLSAYNRALYDPAPGDSPAGRLAEFNARAANYSDSTAPLSAQAQASLGLISQNRINELRQQSPLDFLDQFMMNAPSIVSSGYTDVGQQLNPKWTTGAMYYYNKYRPAWQQYNDFMAQYSPQDQLISRAYNQGLYNPTQWLDVTY